MDVKGTRWGSEDQSDSPMEGSRKAESIYKTVSVKNGVCIEAASLFFPSLECGTTAIIQFFLIHASSPLLDGRELRSAPDNRPRGEEATDQSLLCQPVHQNKRGHREKIQDSYRMRRFSDKANRAARVPIAAKDSVTPQAQSSHQPGSHLVREMDKMKSRTASPLVPETVTAKTQRQKWRRVHPSLRAFT